MDPIDRRITAFIKKHHVFTLATSHENRPYTCSCFYVYLEPLNLFVFTSEHNTRHIRELNEQPQVSGVVALETLIIGRIQGIQFTGRCRELHAEEYKTAHKAYIAKFPVVVFNQLYLWGIEPDFIKMTHNQLGFGKKLIWQKGPV